MRTAWIGRTLAVSISEGKPNRCSTEGCQEPGEWLHWRYRNTDSEQGEHSMIEGWLFCHVHGRESIMPSSEQPPIADAEGGGHNAGEAEEDEPESDFPFFFPLSER